MLISHIFQFLLGRQRVWKVVLSSWTLEHVDYSESSLECCYNWLWKLKTKEILAPYRRYPKLHQKWPMNIVSKGAFEHCWVLPQTYPQRGVYGKMNCIFLIGAIPNSIGSPQGWALGATKATLGIAQGIWGVCLRWNSCVLGMCSAMWAISPQRFFSAFLCT